MHDLTAKKLNHKQAKRNVKHIESATRTKKYIQVLVITCLIFILVKTYGV